MISAPAGVQEQLQALRAMYARQLPDKLAGLDATWRAVLAAPGAGEALSTLHRQAHSLAGSGATYGYTLLSNTARALETYLEALIAGGGHPTAQQQSHIATTLVLLQQMAQEPDHRPPGDSLYRATA